MHVVEPFALVRVDGVLLPVLVLVVVVVVVNANSESLLSEHGDMWPLLAEFGAEASLDESFFSEVTRSLLTIGCGFFLLFASCCCDSLMHESASTFCRFDELVVALISAALMLALEAVAVAPLRMFDVLSERL